MRRFLYSKWFFLVLALVCIVDLAADLADEIWGWNVLNKLEIALDAVAACLSLWIFADPFQPGALIECVDKISHRR